MQEELVTFETAKLAKEKGFDIPVRYGVFGKKMKLTENHGWERNKKLELRNWNTSKSNSYSVPTQSLFQRWLREVHNVFIIVKPMITEYEPDLADEWEVVVYLNVSGAKGNYIKILECKTYEEALEVGLQEALKLIKNE